MRPRSAPDIPASPDRDYYLQPAERIGGNRACLALARKLLKRSYHTLRDLGDQALDARRDTNLLVRARQAPVTPMRRGQLPAALLPTTPAWTAQKDRAAATPSPAGTIAVGTAVAGSPPRRSQRARLTHWALPLGSGVEAHAGPGVQDAREG